MGILNKIIKKDEKIHKEEKKDTKKVVEKKNIEIVDPSRSANKNSKKETISKVKKISKDKIPSHYFDIIKKPHISEKTFNLSQKNQYVFVVSDRANKSEVKKAVKDIYGVSVIGVNIVSVPSKSRRFRGVIGVKSGYKKAIVKLSEGNKIDLMKESK
ncbi:MAG: 50S ribosomal protein L23 [Patescibacteria group bacterium]|nr:50S ribosomal protein L23 [Patescibacteria group bacterium]